MMADSNDPDCEGSETPSNTQDEVRKGKIIIIIIAKI